MRKVNLNTLEMNKYLIIKNLVDNNGNKKRAAVKLQLSIRQINRLINIYKTQSKEGFAHKNRGKSSFKATSIKTKNLIIDLYKTKYENSNIKHFRELLELNENIKLSYTTIYKILRKTHLLSPLVHRQTIRYEKKLIIESKKLNEHQKDLIVRNNIKSRYDSHSRVPRAKYFGECLEMDACKDSWFGDSKTTLHGAIDSSTGAICGLYFDKEETLNGYYHLLEIIWTKFGVPAKFLTDNRTVFIYNGLKQKSMDKDTLTQFGYACETLGIDIETTSIPEKKSRIERLWNTLLHRLPIEMKLAGVNTFEKANLFVNTYITKFNNQFALPINYNTSVFENVDTNKINETLCIIAKRTFDRGCSIKYKNKIYCAYKYDHQMNYCKGIKCLVIETYDGKLLCNVDDEISVLYELPQNKEVSKEFDLGLKDTKVKKGCHIPKLTHPWKQASFMRYLSTLKQYENDAYI